MRSAVPVVVLCGLLAASVLAPAVPTPVVTWTVTGTETYEGIPLLVTGDVVVQPGGTLRLLGADVTVAATGADPVRILVRPGGTLVLADGTDAATGATRPTTIAASGAGYDLEVRPGGRLDVDNATVRDARLALDTVDATFREADVHVSAGPARVVGGKARFEDGRVHGSATDLVHVEGGALLADGTRFDDADGAGIRADPGTEVTLRNATVEDTGLYGLGLDGANSSVRWTTIEATQDYGLRANGGDLLLRDSELSGHCGVFVAAGANATVRDNGFHAHGHGLTLRNAGTVEVARNGIDHAQTGLTLLGTAARVHNNTFNGSNVGVLVKDDPGTTLRNNSFEDHVSAALENRGPATVDARWNWWASPTGPNTADGETVLGPVDVDPWLSSP